MRPYLRTWAIGAVVVLALVAVGGLVVAASGIVPLTASSGHWALTEWILQFGKRRSVATHTIGMEDLELDEAWLVMKGAGHYESGCRPCHGSPGVPTPRIAAAMLPLPPYLPPRIAEWDPEELFYIVKHGIKFTGMPAWQSQERDDEVRAVVAFLIAMPDLDAASYERLVYGEAPAEPAVVPLEDVADPEQPPGPVTASCARCHGTDGRGRGTAAFPKLAGQRPDYLYDALRAYASGDRNSGIMAPVAAGLHERDWRTLAEYYGGLPPGPPARTIAAAPGEPPEGRQTAPALEPLAREQAAPGRDTSAAPGEPGVLERGADLRPPASEGETGTLGAAQAAERGRVIASQGVPSLGVPSCEDCHGPTDHPRNPMYPILAGQYADYLVLQIELFRGRLRGGSRYAPIMHHVVDGLDEQQIRDVAEFYASLDPRADPGR